MKKKLIRNLIYYFKIRKYFKGKLINQTMGYNIISYGKSLKKSKKLSNKKNKNDYYNKLSLDFISLIKKYDLIEIKNLKSENKKLIIRNMSNEKIILNYNKKSESI